MLILEHRVLDLFRAVQFYQYAQGYQQPVYACISVVLHKADSATYNLRKHQNDHRMEHFSHQKKNETLQPYLLQSYSSCESAEYPPHHLELHTAQKPPYHLL